MLVICWAEVELDNLTFEISLSLRAEPWALTDSTATVAGASSHKGSNRFKQIVLFLIN